MAFRLTGPRQMGAVQVLRNTRQQSSGEMMQSTNILVSPYAYPLYERHWLVYTDGMQPAGVFRHT
jgi:hypothetical protein